MLRSMHVKVLKCMIMRQFSIVVVDSLLRGKSIWPNVSSFYCANLNIWPYTSHWITYIIYYVLYTGVFHEQIMIYADIFFPRSLVGFVLLDLNSVLCVCFVDRCLSFFFGHCVVCPSIYGFWLPLWHRQTLLKYIFHGNELVQS